MCGIAGCVGRSRHVTRSVVETQLRTLDHRGPDASAVFEGRGAAIGQNRLSIIDLVTGDPPITNEDGSIAVVLNGEIYNYEEIRKELLNRGHHLRTAGDTEVIAHLAEDLSHAGLADRLQGMFAIGIWDDDQGKLTLVRDRVGKKPLYYWWSADCFIFGSEIKALLAHPEVPDRFREEALAEYLTYGYVVSPETFFEGIRSVPPGHVLIYEMGKTPRLECYWAPTTPGVNGTEPLDITLDEASSEVRRLLRAAVERRLISDVPLGAFLSGGIDSSSIVGLMTELTGSPVKTFTIGFDDKDGFDERTYARTVAQTFRCDHTEFVVTPNAVDLIERLVWHHDQPFGDWSAIPTFLLSELTREHVTVALCGDGGDELFAGYERFAAALYLRRLQRMPSPLLHGARGLLDLAPKKIWGGRIDSAKRFLSVSGLSPEEAYMRWVSIMPIAERESLLDSTTDPYRRHLEIWRSSGGGSLLGRLLDLNLRTYLLDDLLPKVDRMSMAHGLEVRAPMLDTDLIEFALRLPDKLRVRGFTLKRVLKHSVRDLLPDEILTRPKRGFGVPLARWFREDLRTYLLASVGAPKAELRHYLRGDAVDVMIGEHLSGHKDHALALWSLLTLETFLRSRQGVSV